MKYFKWAICFVVMGMMFLPSMSANAAETAIKTGIQKENGVVRYYDSNGKLVKKLPLVKIGKKYYRISKKGVATQLTGTEELAAKRLNSLKAIPKNSKEKTILASLKKAFLWSAKLKYSDNSNHKYSGNKALQYYGAYGFKMKRGDCNTQAATLCWMAKALGYKAKLMQGYVLTEKGLAAHAWAEIKVGKKKYEFDPTFNTSSDAKKLRAKNKYVGFKFKYGDSNTYHYYNLKKKSLR